MTLRRIPHLYQLGLTLCYTRESNSTGGISAVVMTFRTLMKPSTGVLRIALRYERLSRHLGAALTFGFRYWRFGLLACAGITAQKCHH